MIRMCAMIAVRIHNTNTGEGGTEMRTLKVTGQIRGGVIVKVKGVIMTKR